MCRHNCHWSVTNCHPVDAMLEPTTHRGPYSNFSIVSPIWNIHLVFLALTIHSMLLHVLDRFLQDLISSHLMFDTYQLFLPSSRRAFLWCGEGELSTLFASLIISYFSINILQYYRCSFDLCNYLSLLSCLFDYCGGGNTKVGIWMRQISNQLLQHFHCFCLCRFVETWVRIVNFNNRRFQHNLFPLICVL